VPVENASMPDRTVIQWDKDDLDTLGLLKVDVLGWECFPASAARSTSSASAWQDIPRRIRRSTTWCQKADTIGVFQIESRAQMAMLPRLKPACFYDLVIEVAIVRPGPIMGKMVHPYLRRREGAEPVTYASEAVKKVLERTMGVSIFQEQVMQLAVGRRGFHAGRGRPAAARDGRVEAAAAGSSLSATS
jgi:error-prone DNA polymerase